jgi:hypothetical protein
MHTHATRWRQSERGRQNMYSARERERRRRSRRWDCERRTGRRWRYTHNNTKPAFLHLLFFGKGWWWWWWREMSRLQRLAVIYATFLSCCPTVLQHFFVCVHAFVFFPSTHSRSTPRSPAMTHVWAAVYNGVVISAHTHTHRRIVLKKQHHHNSKEHRTSALCASMVVFRGDG